MNAKKKSTKCPHLKTHKLRGGLETFRTIQQYLVSCNFSLLKPSGKSAAITCMKCCQESKWKGNQSNLKEKEENSAVKINGNAEKSEKNFDSFFNGNGRILVCLECAFFGCWSHNHIQEHFEESGHCLAAETLDLLGSVDIYCGHCKDYDYDIDYDLASSAERINGKMAQQRLKLDSNVVSKNSTHYYEWTPTRSEAENLIRSSKRFDVPSHLLGLRGLVNLGNTCFMNCILQCFIHNPLMRNFFLSDMHNRKLCQHRVNEKNRVCFACEMDFLFTEVFSSVKTPFTPHHFLHSMWKHSTYFAGYEQQDAHEFLIAALSGIHSDCIAEGTKGNTMVGRECKCIVHQIFNGVLRSDVTCKTCQTVSTAYDPFFDISLDLAKQPKGGPEISDDLLACLDRFTQPEQLGMSEKTFCTSCNSLQNSTKQLSMHAIPLVLCLHIKRFESQSSGKLDTFVSFAEELDISPFLSVNKRKSTVVLEESEMNGNSVPSSDVLDRRVEKYELFGVVNHTGKMDSGHYISHVKHNNMWYKCDDSWIHPSTLQQVLKSRGYLLFYIQKHLQYSRPPTSNGQHL
eukprot:TRINITY_DN7015_c0_g1_i1.p1 TRINITY_DN7015_c0_g1~~TRINITY_DN7015_c0_g1_i1.p1  ORF type:complete len:571 (-),score=134.77 TRINITY_DN7015_c0_g1_i1:1225-2937(-)